MIHTYTAFNHLSNEFTQENLDFAFTRIKSYDHVQNLVPREYIHFVKSLNHVHSNPDLTTTDTIGVWLTRMILFWEKTSTKLVLSQKELLHIYENPKLITPELIWNLDWNHPKHYLFMGYFCCYFNERSLTEFNLNRLNRFKIEMFRLMNRGHYISNLKFMNMINFINYRNQRINPEFHRDFDKNVYFFYHNHDINASYR